MSHHNACETVVVGQSRYCSITQCPECRMFHVHIGPLSLRLKQEVFEDVCEMLVEAYMDQKDYKEHAKVSMLNH